MSDWSDWQWDGSRWVRMRWGIHGHMEYDYYSESQNIDGLVSSMNHMNIGAHQDTGFQQASTYPYNNTLSGTEGATIAPAIHSQSSVPAHSTSRSTTKAKPADPHGKSKGKEREKGPGKNNRQKQSNDTGNEAFRDSAMPREPFYKNRKRISGQDQPFNPGFGSSPRDEAYSTTSPQRSGAEPPSYQSETTGEAALSDQGQYAHRRHDSGFETVTSPRSATTGDLTTEEDSYVHVAPAQKANDPDDQAEELRAALSEADPYMTGVIESVYPRAWQAQINSRNGPWRGDARDPSNYPTQQPTEITVSYQDSVGDVDGNDDETEPPGMHQLFVVEHSSRFQPGEVFKILWCEPRGAGPHRSEIMTHRIPAEQDGVAIYQGYRRFIVVANDEGHCTCVPILTYERQGCCKRGVKPSKHGIIYQSGRKPRMLPNEPELGFRPVAVHIYERTEKLRKESRVNYAKLTTIEHNFRVFFIGSVEPEDFHNIVLPAVDTCWSNKKRRR